MTFLRRTRTALVVLPVWIVMILTGGQWCLMAGSATAHPVVSSAPVGGHAASSHAASAHDRSVAHGEQGEPVAHGEHGEHDASQPKSQEHGSGGCESQAACSVAIDAAPRVASVPERQRPVRPARQPGAQLASLSLAPELPPPRA